VIPQREAQFRIDLVEWDAPGLAQNLRRWRGDRLAWLGAARLQKTMSLTGSTLSLGLLWVLWPIPAFFFLDTL
jgi:hypothetical protein